MNNTEPPSPGSLTALLGGSFDPIHVGHLHIARSLLTDPLISELAFLPVGRHHFKQDSTVLDYSLRRMLILKTLENGMLLWDEDAYGTGFTSDLIRKLTDKYPQKQFGFVIGSDNLPQLPSWHQYEWLRQHLLFIVVPRPGFPLQVPEPAPRYIVSQISPPEVSSRIIRERVQQGLSIEGMVPANISRDVIRLYRKCCT